jgi:hypothetical protein
MAMDEEVKQGGGNVVFEGSRVFGVVCKGYPSDFQMWLEAAKSYDVYIIFSKSSRVGRLVLKEEAWL